jgi:(p)ppGpp synthase/HD superfamily hydrolase
MTTLIENARAFARDRHGVQLYGDRPYSEHLDAVEAVLVRFGHIDEIKRAAAQLHDVVEDTDTEIDEIARSFGAEVAALVGSVSSEPGANRRERNAKTYPKIRDTSGAVIVKLADRIANVEASLAGSPGLARMYRNEHPGFRDALYTPGVADEMWAHLDGLLV